MSEALETKPEILVVDDEDEFLVVIGEYFAGDYVVRTAREAREALDAIAEREPACLITDLNMPGMDGLKLMRELAGGHPDLPVIVITARGDKHTAIAALRQHAFDFFEKPFDLAALMKATAKAVAFRGFQAERLRLRDNLAKAASDLSEFYEQHDAVPQFGDGSLTAPFSAIRSRCPKMFAALQYAEVMAQTSLPVLITGETGVGKDVIANAIHSASGRAGPFVAANVAGLDDNLFSDTLFGHTAGAFTSADKKRSGLVESAAGGTLFLDEIGDLSAASQVKLLRLLENGEYYPLGSDEPKSTDARIICATHQNLEGSVEDGSFRKDLFFRLEAHRVQIPPLRERLVDLPLLVERFLEIASDELAKDKPTAPKELYTLLEVHDWPGNIRELRGMVFDAVSRHKGGVLSLDSFREKIHGEGPKSLSEVSPLPGITDGPLPTLKEAEEWLTEEALRRTKGNQTVAAGMLGISRQALNKRLSRKTPKKAS